ncbi:hypothetical protein EXT46_10095 [Pseudoalteromonas sp. CO325X]|uniref:hypothetical protein n=1 Tax=Pseudoalteromonas sp. CO325X TaxID=1777262 RepID=UPI0010235249|nr:hypothetical protein [Pseudoalteromonas sp. CO325X]RZF80918.1 hypothetical protein EXT46_10095 [Pseudoalteromonas sp. CO325X]
MHKYSVKHIILLVLSLLVLNSWSVANAHSQSCSVTDQLSVALELEATSSPAQDKDSEKDFDFTAASISTNTYQSLALRAAHAEPGKGALCNLRPQQRAPPIFFK